MVYLCLISSAILSGLAQIILKQGLTWFWDVIWFWEKIIFLAKNLYFRWWLFTYWISMVLRLYVLSKLDVSYAYPFVAISYIVVLVWGYFLWETIWFYKILWVLLILSGIIFITKW